ncbi:TrbI/VirB10 family protein [Brevundimonas sp.]|uniref:TrbI/VirB10 family protein n=1 Tax=Brevundimonas sp. TaxID=1871086 RepID=UPI001AD2A283|nr:TrbI/VirB10 family protein [Brevundimonas sp.]MBN9466278.1 TrbI/VirB10 family protein [Brevundimonas sp.]
MTDTPPVDPAVKAMRLRAEPPRPLRLSRKVALVGVGGLALSITAAVGVGLLNPEADEPPTELTMASTSPPDAVRALPGDYQAPRLGPPLPGDLGGPILDARRVAEAAEPPAQAGGIAHDPRADTRQAALQRLQAEAEAARTSGVVIQGGGSFGGPGPVPAQPAQPAVSAPTPGLGPLAIPTVSGAAATLLAGSIIEASLVTGIRSDLPGPVLGQITADVHDTLTGRRLLVPKGARLIGLQDAQVVQGQSRLQVRWTRILLPNGRSILLDDQIASDSQGYVGLEDRTDRRWGERLRAATLTTLLAMSTAAVDIDADDRWGRTARDGATRGVDTLGRGVVEQGLNLPPRITIRPGYAFRIILTQDLDLPPYGD